MSKTTTPAKKIDISTGTWHSFEKATALAATLNAQEAGPEGDGWTYKVVEIPYAAYKVGVLVAYDETGEAIGTL